MFPKLLDSVFSSSVHLNL